MSSAYEMFSAIFTILTCGVFARNQAAENSCFVSVAGFGVPERVESSFGFSR